MISLTYLCVLALLYLVNTNVIKIDDAFDSLENAALEGLEFVFPEYYVSLGDLRYDPQVTKNGWLVIDDVTLTDAVNERSIFISQIRMSPSLSRMFFGRTKFYHIVVDQATIDYRLEPPKQNTEIGFPIAGLDIPSNILTKYGDITISDMVLRLVSAEREELFSLRDLQAGMQNNPNGYEARIGARQVDSQRGSFVFNVSRDDEKLVSNGFARNYVLSEGNKMSLDFDVNLDFLGVPRYDFTETQDNISQPYQYLEDGNGLMRLKGDGLEAEAHYNYDKEKQALAIEDMRLALGEQVFRGNVDVELGDAILARGYDFGGEYQGRQGDVNFDGGSFLARINLTEQKVEIGELSFANDYFHLFGQGVVQVQPRPLVAFDGHLEEISQSSIGTLWPASLGDSGYAMFVKRFKFSDMKDIDFWLRYDNGFKMEAVGNGHDLDVQVADFLPAINGENALLRLTQDNFMIKAPSAGLNGYEDDIAIHDVTFWMPDLDQKPIHGLVDFDGDGSLPALLKVLNNEPISAADRANINTAKCEGTFQANFDMDIPFQSGLKFEDIDMSVNGEIQNVLLRDYISGQDLGTPRAKVKITQNGMNLDGPFTFGAISGTADFSQKFAPGSGANIKVAAVATPEVIRSYGVTLPSNINLGRVPVEADVKVIPGGVDFDARANLTDLGFSAPGLGQLKSRGSSGSVRANGRFQNGALTINDMNAEAGGLLMRGNLQPNGLLTLSRVKVNELYDGEFLMQGKRFVVRNGTLDTREYDFATSEPSNDAINLEMENVNIKLQGNFSFLQVYGKLATGANTRGEFTGLVGGKAPAKATVWNEGKQYHVKLFTNDMGGTFRGLGLFGDIYGGDLGIHVKSTGYPGVFAGKVEGHNFAVNNSTTAIQLLQAASIFGGLEGNQLSFEALNGEIVVEPNRIGVYSGYLYGQAIGITLGGSYFNKSKRADFFGVVTPAYLLNGAFQRIPGFGQLLGGNLGEGLFGVTYRIMGSAPNLNIQANPLALLTPGFTRDIWGNVPQASRLKPEFRIEE